MVCTSLGSLLRPLFYFLCYIHFSLSVKGLPYMTFEFFDTPFVTVTNQLIVFLLSAFWGPPLPHLLRTSFMEAPLYCITI